MGNAATPIAVSAAARAQHPGLAVALTRAGLTLTAGAPVQLIAVAETSDCSRLIRFGVADIPRLMLAPEPGCIARIDASPDTLEFAAALVAALLQAPGAPAAADAASCQLLATAERVAARDVTVLIGGPSGTGKEVLARTIHDRSPRRDDPFVAVNCAALPESMLEAWLFGHERGAFTGAAASSRGLFRAADGGTLLLDEIAELPLALQAKLLRVLQEREVLPVGATRAVPINVRIIAATNRNLRQDIDAGRFRADLFYRLAVFPLATLPLSQRPADLLPLTAALLLRASHAGLEFAWPTPAALMRLGSHGWPGNVRELDNVLQRALIYTSNNQLQPTDIVFDLNEHASPEPLSQSLTGQVRAREETAIRAALAACAGRRAATAQRLGISERTLRYKLAALSMGGSLPARATLQ